MELEIDIIITLRDAKNFYGGCVPQWKIFCEANGYAWKDVVDNGLLASKLLATQHGMAIRLVEHIYKERGLSL